VVCRWVSRTLRTGDYERELIAHYFNSTMDLNPVIQLNKLEYTVLTKKKTFFKEGVKFERSEATMH
jgi:hypothetical protein